MKFYVGIFRRLVEASIKVVPGEFDDSLSWPCKEKVRVTLSSTHLFIRLTNQL